MNASTGDAPESRAELVPAARIAPMTAIPSRAADLAERVEHSRADAGLVDRDGAQCAAAVIGVITTAMPTPPSSIPGRSARYDESVCSWAKTSSAPLSIVIPAVISQDPGGTAIGLRRSFGSQRASEVCGAGANIILATADGCGTAEIMRRSGKSKPVVWRWGQARFMAEGVEGLTRDKTRKPGKPPLPTGTVQRVVDLALGPPPGETTHWTGRMLAKAAGVSLRVGATYSRSPPTRAASHPHVQAVERPEVRRETERRRRPLCRSSPPMRSSSRSTKEPEFRRSTVPSQGCR